MDVKGVLYMAQPVNVNFKLDADVKKRMEWACSELGLSMSAAFTIFAKYVSTAPASQSRQRDFYECP